MAQKTLGTKSLSVFMLVMFFTINAFPSENFDLSKNLVNISDFTSGGPGKDAIPAIVNPKFIPGSKPFSVFKSDLVIGVHSGGEAKAYPINILNRHEIVNDHIGGVPIAVTWCPLTKSGMVFKRRIRNETLTFGVSGLLYNSNLVMYDRNNNGLWPQLTQGAVTGSFSGETLTMIPSRVMTWGDWKKIYPGTKILFRERGHFRYSTDPYDHYHLSSATMFPVKYMDNRLPPKKIVIGITIKGISKAYPIERLKRNYSKPIEDIIEGRKIRIYRGKKDTAYITDEDENLLPAVTMYWFAWSSFNKKTLIYGQ
ncbi:MAG: DUF3179 domain-containing protein [Omnitrophica bacterium]|nr:DUF3179 domain-containing protein [Candidatus Omnitrophota bacterium]